ncbi:MAG: AsmA family protein [Gammaproteobacteria bacterium]
MTKPVKILLALILIPVVAIAVVLMGIVVLVDPNDYRGEIEAVVAQSTGRALTIEGEIDLSIFPWLGLELGRTRLGNAPGFDATPFAQVEGVEVRARLLPLLNRELEVGRLVLRGLQLNLQVDAEGRSNWADLAAGGGEPGTTPGESAESAAGAPAIAALAIGGLEVTGAQLGYRDASSGAAYRVQDLALTSGPLALGKPTELDLRFRASANQPEIEATVALQSTLTLASSLQQVALKGTRLTVEGRGEGLPVPELSLQFQGYIGVDLAADTLSVANASLKTLGMEAVADLQGRAITQAPRLEGRLRLEPFSPRDLLKRLGQEAPETADPGVLGKLTVDTKFSASPEQAALSDLKLLLDDTAISGQLAVTDFGRQALRFELAVDGINLDRYLPPAKETPPPTAGTATVGAEELPLELLRPLDVEGKLRIGRLTVSNLTSEDVTASLSAKNGQIRIHPATARLYGGRYSGDIGLDARGKQPTFSFDETLSGVQIGPLLKDLMGDDKLGGTANLKARLTARGSDPAAIRNTLSGTASFQFTDGMVKGINVAQLLREANAKLKGEKPPPGKEPNATDFTSLAGSATIRNGLVSNRDLEAKSPLLRIEGAGSINLPKETMDYRVKVAVVGTLEGQGGQALQELKGLTIPLRIHGTFAEPRFRVELDKVLAEKNRAKIEAKKRELKEKEAQIKAEQKARLEEKKEELKQKLLEKLLR